MKFAAAFVLIATVVQAGLTKYSFPNGLRAVLFPDTSSPRITVNMVYMVGSRHAGF